MRRLAEPSFAANAALSGDRAGCLRVPCAIPTCAVATPSLSNLNALRSRPALHGTCVPSVKLAHMQLSLCTPARYTYHSPSQARLRTEPAAYTQSLSGCICARPTSNFKRSGALERSSACVSALTRAPPPRRKHRHAWLASMPNHASIPTIYHRLYWDTDFVSDFCRQPARPLCHRLTPRLQTPIRIFCAVRTPYHCDRLLTTHLLIGRSAPTPLCPTRTSIAMHINACSRSNLRPTPNKCVPNTTALPRAQAHRQPRSIGREGLQADVSIARTDESDGVRTTTILRPLTRPGT